MHDYYHIPALVLTALLLPAFGYLYLRFRDTRTLLWFLGFLFSIARMLQLYDLGFWTVPPAAQPWFNAAGQSAIQISSALFVASLSPLRFRVGRFHVLYAIPYIIPLVVYSILFEGVYGGHDPTGPMAIGLAAIGMPAIIAACVWGSVKGNTPIWQTVITNFGFSILAVWLYFARGAAWPLNIAETANFLVTALLVVYVFRRVSPGVLLSVLGFVAWSISSLQIFPAIHHNPVIDLALVRVVILGKVVAAMGMILLALEDEVAVNMAAQQRERRARRELEAYAGLILSRRRVEDFDRQGAEICATVATHSRFSQVALLLEVGGRYRLAGTAGLDDATAGALSELAGRIASPGFLSAGSVPSAVEHSQTLLLDLTPWLMPGDDLRRLHATSLFAVPMIGRSAVAGALLLAGMHPAAGSLADPLRPDDLLPIEMLAARLQASRSQTMMLEKLIDSEKFAGLGQLAGNVTQQLNNPLTVILGYSSLLVEAPNLSPLDRRGIDSILNEARRMRSTLESLSRISRAPSGQLTAVSISELLADMEQLHRHEFLHRSIEFRLSIAPALPRVLCNAQQLRQAVLHCLQFAIGAVSSLAPGEPRTIRLEATAEGGLAQILVAHSGAGFLNPERAFDPFTPAQANGETAGLGLSLCATILRDHNGRASAVNLEPRGAAIILELTAA